MMTKNKVTLLLSYDGSAFKGWQRQNSTADTVQGQLEKALSRVLDEPISLCGAGRTDAGVHAHNQVAHFWTQKDPNKYKWLYALNGPWTSPAITVKGAWQVSPEFHAIGSALSKTYKYLILNRATPSSWRRNFVYHHQRPLDFDYLNEMSRVFVGTHDFKSFQTSGTEVPSTVRTIYQAGWQRGPKGLWQFYIRGDGFLRQMVRNIIGTLIYMENNQLPKEWLLEVLKAKDRQAAKGTAEPQGLYLDKIKYSKKSLQGAQKLKWY